jgi:hypothetical protein
MRWRAATSFSLPVFGEGRVGSFYGTALPVSPHPALRATLPEGGEGEAAVATKYLGLW